jgi:hypothetical protein
MCAVKEGGASGRGAFRGRKGTVVERGPGKSEYGVKFDDTQVVEHVQASWLVALPPEIKKTPA